MVLRRLPAGRVLDQEHAKRRHQHHEPDLQRAVQLLVAVHRVPPLLPFGHKAEERRLEQLSDASAIATADDSVHDRAFCCGKVVGRRRQTRARRTC